MMLLEKSMIIDGICQKVFDYLEGEDTLNFALFLSLNKFVNNDTKYKIICQYDMRNISYLIQYILPKFDFVWMKSYNRYYLMYTKGKVIMPNKNGRYELIYTSILNACAICTLQFSMQHF